MERPRLIVGIVVDQMRWDYLTRYYDYYGDGSFRRLMDEGYNCNRMMINYLPAVTAVGHTSIYTGSVPAFTGIVGNEFFLDGKMETSVSDNSVSTVGCQSSVGKASPRKLLVTTMTDELRLATNFRSKVIGIALKDRAAILPAGHCANASYWFDTDSLKFVSSTYYMKQLPKWVEEFNASGKAKQYVEMLHNRKSRNGYWDLLYDDSVYVQSVIDRDKVYYEKMRESIDLSPYGNSVTADMAMVCIKGEKLGRNVAGVPDFLAVSFSSTDKVGHKVGPNSVWMEDVYLRLDKDIARLLDCLDETVGKGQYLVFLTADHAASHSVGFLKENGIPTGTWDYTPELRSLNDFLKSEFHVENDIVTSFCNYNVYFDDNRIAEIAKRKLMTFAECKDAVMASVSAFMESRKSVAYCFSLRNIPSYVPEPVRTMAQNGYNPKRSGDMQIVTESQFMEDWKKGAKKGYDGIIKGTNHIVWNPYDTHIPFIVMGKNVRHGWDNNTYHITDIAATLTAILNIQQPSGCVGNAIDMTK